MLDIFTITEISYLVVSLFFNLLRPLFVFTFVILSSLVALFAFFWHSDKSAVPSPDSFSIFE